MKAEDLEIFLVNPSPSDFVVGPWLLGRVGNITRVRLGLKRTYALDRFDLQYQPAFHQDVDAVAAIKPNPAVRDRYRYFGPKRHPMSIDLEAQTTPIG